MRLATLHPSGLDQGPSPTSMLVNIAWSSTTVVIVVQKAASGGADLAARPRPHTEADTCARALRNTADKTPVQAHRCAPSVCAWACMRTSAVSTGAVWIAWSPRNVLMVAQKVASSGADLAITIRLHPPTTHPRTRARIQSCCQRFCCDFHCGGMESRIIQYHIYKHPPQSFLHNMRVVCHTKFKAHVEDAETSFKMFAMSINDGLVCSFNYLDGPVISDLCCFH